MAVREKLLMRRVFIRVTGLFVLVAVFVPPLVAEPRLPHLFSNHMVLQRDKEIAVWGWGDPGEKISVSLGSNARETTAASDGRWKVALSPMPAGGPFTLVVKGEKTITLKDVMLGEVWIASGQSNMTYPLSGATGAAGEIPKANDPGLRFFTVPKRIAVVSARRDTTWPSGRGARTTR